VALGILWEATELFPWSLSQMCFTVVYNVSLFPLVAITDMCHCAGTIPLENRNVFRCPGCKVLLCFVFL